MPVFGGTVSRLPGARHLVPRRGASWDGWFAIAIFPPESPLRWAKSHFFSRNRTSGHPFAAVEGLVESELMIAWADDNEVGVLQRKVDNAQLKSSSDPLRVSLPGRFTMEGSRPRYTMFFSLPEEGSKAFFEFETGWPIWWAREGRFLNYVGQHSAVRLDLSRDGREESARGFGVMEHVCGASAPFDFTGRMPFSYHWDVLAFHTPGSPFDSAAGLCIGFRGETLIQMKAACKLPGHREAPMRGLSVRYLEVNSMKADDGTEMTVPASWEGVMRGRRGEFRYVARASTPLAAIIPGGGMLGFEFEGAYHDHYQGTRAWSGTGFSEYGFLPAYAYVPDPK